MPGSSAVPFVTDAPYIHGRHNSGIGQVYPGGVFQIVSNSIANPTVVATLAPHGLATGDTVFFTNSTTSSPLLTAAPQQVVTVIDATHFSVPVNVTVAGTAGAFDYAITSIPVAAIPTVNTGTAHGLRVGDTVTIVASGSTPSLDGAQVVTAVLSATSFQIAAVAAITVAGSTTAAHYTKTIFYSDIMDRFTTHGTAGIVITSVIGTTPVSTLVDIQGSLDGTNWFNVAYSTAAAPQTQLYAQLTITTAVATSYKLLGVNDVGYMPYRFLRLRFQTNTNIIVSALVHSGEG